MTYSKPLVEALGEIVVDSLSDDPHLIWTTWMNANIVPTKMWKTVGVEPSQNDVWKVELSMSLKQESPIKKPN